MSRFRHRAGAPQPPGRRGGRHLPAAAAGLLVLAALVAAAAEASASVTPAAGAGSAISDTLRYSLDACVERALARGEEMQRAEADHSTAHAGYLMARSTALPQVNLNVTYNRQYESIYGKGGGEMPSFEADTTASLEQRVRDLEEALPGSGFIAVAQLLTAFASENSWNAALSVRQKLFQGGSIWASVSAAKHALKAAELLRQDRREDVTLNVRRAYLDALLADRTERIARLGLEQAENQLQRVRLRQEAGQASEFELLQAEVERDNQVPQVRGAHSLREMAYLELRRLCNLPAYAPLALTSPLLEDRALPSEPTAVDTVGLVAGAMEASGIAALEEVMQARRNAVTVASAGRWPELSVFANVTQQAFPQDPLPHRRDWLRSKSAGIAINWNIFDGFLTSGAVEEARANRSRAEQDLLQARELVNQAVEQGRLELDRSAADLRARSRTVQLARRALDLATLRYEEGASSRIEVSDARIAWEMAQSNEARARRDYFVALALLERYSGRPLFQTTAGLESGR